jgi:hypothetical protein
MGVNRSLPYLVLAPATIACFVCAGSFIKHRTAAEYACRSHMFRVDLYLLGFSLVTTANIWTNHSLRLATLCILQSPLNAGLVMSRSSTSKNVLNVLQLFIPSTSQVDIEKEIAYWSLSPFQSCFCRVISRFLRPLAAN